MIRTLGHLQCLTRCCHPRHAGVWRFWIACQYLAATTHLHFCMWHRCCSPQLENLKAENQTCVQRWPTAPRGRATIPSTATSSPSCAASTLSTSAWCASVRLQASLRLLAPMQQLKLGRGQPCSIHAAAMQQLRLGSGQPRLTVSAAADHSSWSVLRSLPELPVLILPSHMSPSG